MERPFATLILACRHPGIGLAIACVAFAACSNSTLSPQSDTKDAAGREQEAPDLAGDLATDFSEAGGDSGAIADASEADSAGTDIPDLGQTDAASDAGPPDGGGDTLLPDSFSCWNGSPCDDSDPCTFWDTCHDGVCSGKPYSCDDGRSCTQDSCDGNGSCVFAVLDGTCLVNNACRLEGETAPGNDCLVCSPGETKKNWSMLPSGTECGGDGPSCLAAGTCTKGQCSGKADNCDDGNLCTDDACVIGQGCTHSNNFDLCEDGDPCTLWDKCSGGTCLPGPQPLQCDDGNPCTDDFCNEEGCVHSPRIGPCSDGLACTADDECLDGQCVPGDPDPCDDSNQCTADTCIEPVGCIHLSNNNPCCLGLANVCDDGDPCTLDDCSLETGECFHEAYEGPCSDQDKCTKGDVCIAGACVGQPVDCDDGNGCTKDSCAPESGCIHVQTAGECDDKNACTQGDTCMGGKCKGTAASCNDGSPCTLDSCNPKTGCLHQPVGGPCDDSDKCTTEDVCTGGACLGTPFICPAVECQLPSCHPLLGCQYTLIDAVPCNDGDPCTAGDLCSAGKCVHGDPVCTGCEFKFASLAHRVVEMAVPSGASPEQAIDLDSDGKPDNAFASVAGFVNGGIQGALDKGDIHLLFEHHGLSGPEGSYTLNAFAGKLAPESAGCAFATATCSFVVSPESFDLETCTPIISFDNAVKKGGKITAGGKGYQFVCQVPIAGKGLVSLVLHDAVLQAKEAAGPGKQLTGILAGAIPKQSLLEAVPSEFKGLVDMMLANDIDTDGDGIDDAASVAFAFVANSAGIKGFIQ